MTDPGFVVSDELAAWGRAMERVVTDRIDRKDIVRFAVAVGATSDIHFDPDAARRRGFPDIVAPPLYYVALRTGLFNLVPLAELHEEGTPRRDLPPLDFAQAMAGETRAEIERPFVAGEVVVGHRRVAGITGKQGRSGPMTLVEFEYRYSGGDGATVAVEHFTRIFR